MLACLIRLQTVTKHMLLSKKFENLKIFFSKKRQIGERFKPNDLIRKVTNDMKKTKSLKYDSVPDEVEQSAIAEDQFCEIYHFYCIIRVQKMLRNKYVDTKVDIKVKRK